MEKVQIYVLSRENAKWISQEYSQSPNEPLSPSASGVRVVHLAFLIHICHSCHMAVAYLPDMKGSAICPSKYQMSKMCCVLTKPKIKVITCIIKKKLISFREESEVLFLYILFTSFKCFIANMTSWLKGKSGSENDWELGVRSYCYWSPRNKSWIATKITVSQLPYIRFWRNTSIL